jgi:multidrug efflux pump subunit AcrB
MNLPKFAVGRTSLVLAFTALALFWSIASALTMQRREDPGTEQRQTEVVTLYPGATTENVEQLVTKKIADDLRGASHVLHVTGTSRPGISDITVEFDDEMQHADGPLREVREHLDDLKAQLPAGIDGPLVIADVWKTYPIVLGVTARGLDARRLRDVAHRLADRLSALPDVALVDESGELQQRIAVDLDTRALSAYGFTPGDVSAAIAAKNALVRSGSVALGGRIAQVDPSDAPRTAADVAAIAVAAPGGRVVRVGDVARVAAAYPDPPDELVRVNGEPGVALAIQAKETSSVTALGPEVDAALDAARQQWPAGIAVTKLADQPRTVDERVADFFLNLVLGVIVVTVLVALLMGLRNGLIVGATVALSIVLTFGAMPLVHVDVNQISILALIIALGIIVDAGVVAVDNVERLLRTGMDRPEAAWRGVQQLWFPLLTSTLVAMSSFLPFRLMGGSVGDFVRDLAVVTTLALAASLLVAYFLTPILCARFAVAAGATGGRGPAARVRSAFDGALEVLQRAYVRFAGGAMERPLLTVGIVLALLTGAVFELPNLGVQFFPAADRAQFFVEVSAPDGTDIRTTEAIVKRVEARIARQPGVTAYGAFVGRGAPRFYYNVLSEQPKPSYAQILVDTSDAAASRRIVPDLRAALADVPGARIEVKQLEQGPPVGAPIQVRLAASDAGALPAVAAQVRAVLHDVPGAVAVRDSLGEPTTKLDVAIARDRAAVAGVADADVARLLALAYGGETAAEIREADRQTPVVVRLPAELRGDAEALASTAVRTADGRRVALGEFADVRLATQTSTATLRDGLPTVTVAADVVGRLPSAVLADFRRTADALALPPGVRLTYAGEDEQTLKSFRNLLIAAIVGLLVNQILLLWEFRTLRLSLVILSAVPLGLIGAVLGLAVTGNHFGFVASLGLASLGGIVTNHTIVLFEYANRELAHDSALDMQRALIVAGTKRLRPILLTVVTSIAGLLPLAFSAQTLWKPFCWVVIFGLAGSMLMTLVAIPAIYRLAAGKMRLEVEPRAIMHEQPA